MQCNIFSVKHSLCSVYMYDKGIIKLLFSESDRSIKLERKKSIVFNKLEDPLFLQYYLEFLGCKL